MSIEVKLPELGENISSGDLLKVLVKVGEKINKDQALLELETDKAAIEVPSPTSGVVRQIHVKEGQKLKVGQVIISLDENGAKPPEPQRTPETFAAGIGQGGRPPIEQPLGKGIETRTATATTPAPGNGQQAKPAAATTGGTRTTEVKLPELGENVAGGDLLKVLVKAGDQINKEQALLEIETDKAAIEVPSPIAGLVKQVHVQPGQKIKVGQLIFTVEESGAARYLHSRKRSAPQRLLQPHSQLKRRKLLLLLRRCRAFRLVRPKRRSFLLRRAAHSPMFRRRLQFAVSRAKSASTSPRSTEVATTAASPWTT